MNSFLEHYTTLATAVSNRDDNVFDLSFFWKTELPYKIVNDDFFPSLSITFEYYAELFWDDLDLLLQSKKKKNVEIIR